MRIINADLGVGRRARPDRRTARRSVALVHPVVVGDQARDAGLAGPDDPTATASCGACCGGVPEHATVPAVAQIGTCDTIDLQRMTTVTKKLR